jgi:hypothetical protein
LGEQVASTKTLFSIKPWKYRDLLPYGALVTITKNLSSAITPKDVGGSAEPPLSAHFLAERFRAPENEGTAEVIDVKHPVWFQ